MHCASLPSTMLGVGWTSSMALRARVLAVSARREGVAHLSWLLSTLALASACSCTYIHSHFENSTLRVFKSRHHSAIALEQQCRLLMATPLVYSYAERQSFFTPSSFFVHHSLRHLSTVHCSRCPRQSLTLTLLSKKSQ